MNTSVLEQLLGPEATWEPCDPLERIPRDRSLVRDPSGDGLTMRFFRRPEAPHLVAKAWFGPGAEGPPSHAHGGAIMAVLDEAMGAAVWAEGHAVVLARFTIDLKAMVPLLQVALAEAWVECVDGRKIEARGRLIGADGLDHAHCHGLFIAIGTERFDRLNDVSGEGRPSSETPP